MIRHVVLLKFKPEAPPEQRETLIGMVRALPDQIDFIRAMEVGVNITDSPRAFDFVLMADVDDENALKGYAVHPNHQPVIKLSGELCSVTHIVDYIL